MKNKILAAVMAVLIVGTTAGCGSKVPVGQGEELPADNSVSFTDQSVNEESEEDPEEEDDSCFSAAELSPADETVSDEAAASRNEYVIYCPDDTMPDLFKTCYPGYEEVSKPVEEEEGIFTAEGLIGEVQIHWIITDYLMDDEKAGHLDELLVRQQTEGASDYDWVDLFVIDELNIEKYIGDEVNVAMDLGSLGISKHDMKEQLSYTQQLGSDHRKQRGAALDISPGVFLFRRSVAKAVLGTDDPETVGKAVNDWDAFYETADRAAQSGYKMLAGYDAAFDVYAQSVEDDWYSDDGTLHIDDHLMKWVETTKTFAEKGICGDVEMASDEWDKGIFGKGDVFGYFLSTEEIEFIKSAISEDNVDSYGDWGIVAGPGNWYRGGTWLCAAVGSPSPGLSGEIIRNLTCNEQVMKDIYEKTGITVNNRQVLLGNVSEKETESPEDTSVSERTAEQVEGSEDSSVSERTAEQVEGSEDSSVSERTVEPVESPEDSSVSERTVEPAASLEESNGNERVDESAESESGRSSDAVSGQYEISLTDESVAEAAEKGIGFFLSEKEDIVGDAFCDPFFAGQQTGPVYLEAAKRVSNPVADGERWVLDDMFLEAYYPYFRGECSANDSLASFYQNAKGLIIMEDEEW